MLNHIPANTKHLHNIYTILDRRCINVIQMFCLLALDHLRIKIIVSNAQIKYCIIPPIKSPPSFCCYVNEGVEHALLSIYFLMYPLG